MTKTAPHLVEMDDIQHCSLCKMPFPLKTQHDIHKAFEEHVRKAHQPQQTGGDTNQVPGKMPQAPKDG